MQGKDGPCPRREGEDQKSQISETGLGYNISINRSCEFDMKLYGLLLVILAFLLTACQQATLEPDGCADDDGDCQYHTDSDDYCHAHRNTEAHRNTNLYGYIDTIILGKISGGYSHTHPDKAAGNQSRRLPTMAAEFH